MKIVISEEQVKAVFATAKHQADYLIGIYQLVFPKWDEIKKINGWPAINEATWKSICRMAVDFDRIHHSDCMPGGAWLNSGFSGYPSITDLDMWEIDLSGVTIELNSGVVITPQNMAEWRG